MKVRTGRLAARGPLCAALALVIAAWWPSVEAAGGEPREQERAAELERLQREVETLRAVLVQMVEIERMRVELLSQALRGTGGTSLAGSPGGQPGSRSATGQDPQRSAPSLDAGREARDLRATVQPASSTTLGSRKPEGSARPGSEGAVSGGADQGPKLRRAGPATGVLSGRVVLPDGVPVAYVFVENVRGALLKNKRVSIQQRNKKFLPEWAVVQVGTVVEFPNDDDIYHNVFSLTPGATFDLGLYRRGEQTKEYRFTTPGVVDIYCNIHPRMVASLLVVPNELVTRVKDDGTFELAGVPEGKRKIVAWAPGAELGTEWVDVGAGETRVELKLAPRSSAHKNKQGQAYGSYD